MCEAGHFCPHPHIAVVFYDGFWARDIDSLTIFLPPLYIPFLKGLAVCGPPFYSTTTELPSCQIVQLSPLSEDNSISNEYLQMYMYLCSYTYLHVGTCTLTSCLHTHAHTCTHIHTHAHTHTHTHTHIHTRTSA